MGGRWRVEEARQRVTPRDVEFEDHLVQVIFDRPPADEQLRRDLGVRVGLGGQFCDLELLIGQAMLRVHGTRMVVFPARPMRDGLVRRTFRYQP